MGKYFSNSNSGVFAESVGACSTGAAGDGAVIFDLPTDTPPPIIPTVAVMCWKIAGPPVIIDDTFYSNHQGFERCNFAMHTDGSQPAVPSQFYLPFSAIV